MHLDERRKVARVAEVVGETTLCEARASRRFHGNNPHPSLSSEVEPDKWEDHAAEVRTSSCATHQYVRELAGHLHLLESLETDHGLMQQDVVKDAAQGILGQRILGRHFDSLRDGN